MTNLRATVVWDKTWTTTTLFLGEWKVKNGEFKAIRQQPAPELKTTLTGKFLDATGVSGAVEITGTLMETRGPKPVARKLHWWAGPRE